MGMGFILALLVAGFVLLAIELLIAPGFTIFGVLGGITITLALVLSFVYLPVQTAAVLLFFALLLVLGIIWTFMKFGFKGKLGLRYREAGFKPHQADYTRLLGKTGLATTPLRPSGTVRIEERLFSAQSQGEFIEKGESVSVIRVEGNKIIVNKLN
ncbi:MAG: hypothetical protein Kow0037_03770 [Calditrichia bacterium]